MKRITLDLSTEEQEALHTAIHEQLGQNINAGFEVATSPPAKALRRVHEQFHDQLGRPLYNWKAGRKS